MATAELAPLASRPTAGGLLGRHMLASGLLAICKQQETQAAAPCNSYSVTAALTACTLPANRASAAWRAICLLDHKRTLARKRVAGWSGSSYARCKRCARAGGGGWAGLPRALVENCAMQITVTVVQVASFSATPQSRGEW